MKAPRKDGKQTRRKLLLVGSEVFVEKGYKGATIREIGRRAAVNPAAVTYHFGSKAKLYRESWHYALLKSMRAVSRVLSHCALPEERLKAHVASLLGWLSKDNKEFLIMLRELSDPTGLLDDTIMDVVSGFEKSVWAAVRQTFGNETSEMEVQFQVIGILAQCVYIILAETPILDKFGLPKIPDSEAYAHHVVRLVLANVNASKAERKFHTVSREVHEGHGPMYR